jgi:DNA-binding phage protein
VAYDDWLIERLKDPREAAEYLEAAIDEADQAVSMLVRRQVAHARERFTRSRAP